MAQQDGTPLALLLQRGQSWQQEGKVFQAIAMYLRLTEYHSGTPEALRARERLLDLAQQFEGEGKVHQATHLYQRLAALQEPASMEHPEVLRWPHKRQLR